MGIEPCAALPAPATASSPSRLFPASQPTSARKNSHRNQTPTDTLPCTYSEPIDAVRLGGGEWVLEGADITHYSPEPVWMPAEPPHPAERLPATPAILRQSAQTATNQGSAATNTLNAPHQRLGRSTQHQHRAPVPSEDPNGAHPVTVQRTRITRISNGYGGCTEEPKNLGSELLLTRLVVECCEKYYAAHPRLRESQVKRFPPDSERHGDEHYQVKTALLQADWFRELARLRHTSRDVYLPEGVDLVTMAFPTK
eukprot:SAG31_NODE_7019_length_1814_cov_22.676968_1_plen_254_part_10